MKNSDNNTFVNITLSIISIIALLLSIEIIFRVWFPQPFGMKYRSNTLGFKLTPNWKGKGISNGININSIGLRDYEIGKKAQGVFRILILGDSQTFGNGIKKIDDTYPKVLESILNKNIQHRKFEVINAGVGSYSTYQEFQYLKESGMALEPDLVLIGFFIGNDFGDNFHFTHKLMRKQQYNKIDLFLLSHSHAYFFLKNKINVLIISYNLNKFLNNAEEIKAGSDDIANNFQYFPMTFCIKNYSPEMLEAAFITKKILTDMNDYIKERKIKMSLIIIPTMQQIYHDIFKEEMSKRNKNFEDYDILKPNNMLHEFAGEKNIAIIDLYPVFEKLAKLKKLYFWEGHLNEEGCAAAGKEIYQQLLSHNLLPAG